MSKTNKIHAVLYTLLGVAVIFCAVMWYRCYKRNKELDIAVNNTYDKAFFELADYVTDIDTLLSKAQLASTPAQLASISNEIFMQAAEAKSCFGELPTQNTNLEHTAKFLSQVGDYTYVLSQNMINGTEITEEEYENLNSLNRYAAELAENLNKIEEKIYSGEMNFQSVSSGMITEVKAADDIFKDLENVEKSFEGYPSLIYDGPFSEHIENMQSYMLSSAEDITEEEARKKAKEFLGKRGDNLKAEAEMKNTAIEAYVFGKETKNGYITVSVTKKGGYVLYFLESRDVKANNFDVAAATEAAAKFLEKRGFSDCADNYYEVDGNVATINFAYSQDGVKCYSDLTKVRVALDNGEVIGLECKGYLMNHRDREIGGAVLTEEQARERVSAHLEVNAVSLAVIPKDSLREVLCYEFKGSCMGKNFIVYINAENGREENILLLIESENGILTI